MVMTMTYEQVLEWNDRRSKIAAQMERIQSVANEVQLRAEGRSDNDGNGSILDLELLIQDIRKLNDIAQEQCDVMVGIHQADNG
jgi:hypothetical protein